MTTASSSNDAERSQTDTMLSTIFDRSRTAESMRTARRWSENAWFPVFVSVYIQRLAEILTRWVGGSILYMIVFGLVDRGNTTLTRWISHSGGYRWLIADPDPDVIVIDLRETKTVGPLLAVLDRVLAVGIPAMSHSRTRRLWAGAVDRFVAAPLRYVGAGLVFVAAVGAVRVVLFGSSSWAAVGGVLGMALVGLLCLTDGRSLADLRERRPVRVLCAVFAPPEPPERSDIPESKSGIDRERRPENE